MRFHMKKITLILNDDGLLEDLANAAERDGVALEDVVIDAIYYWDAETTLAPEEEAAIEADLRDWKKHDVVSWEDDFRMLKEDDAKLKAAFLNLEREGGTEARAFLKTLMDKMDQTARDSSRRAVADTGIRRAGVMV